MSRVYWVYGAALAIGSPLIALYLAVRAWRSADYRASLGQRLGWIPRASPGGIWVHAVSVGEVISVAGLIRRWKAERPDCPVTVSAGTIAGRKLALEKLVGLADEVVYAPLDFGWVVRRFLGQIRPRLVVVMETEIWPNLWRESVRAGARLVVVNGRISDKAYPSYQRWRRFFAAVLPWPQAILAQTGDYVRRYRELGAPAERVTEAGNLKYDFAPGEPPDVVQAFLRRVQPERVWIAASTMPPASTGDPDEDEVVAQVFERLAAQHPRLLLVLAPRRPERFSTAAATLERRGIRVVRRSTLGESSELELPGCLLLDTIGELAACFALADVVFMGGTLVDRGGHNLLEPAYFGKAIVSGPNLQNFPEIAADFRERAAFVEVRSAEELERAVSVLLVEDGQRKEIGRKARLVATQRTGATARVLQVLRGEFAEGVPARPLGPLRRVALAPLARLWSAGSRRKRVRQRAEAERLSNPVVSIGNLAMGGAGKTPFALMLARMLAEHGAAPAFLTRGYRRQSSDVVVARPGDAVPVSATGDEAQLLLRSGLGPVGIAARRIDAGRRIEANLPAAKRVFLLDDGFQHWRLDRDIDIVLIDVLDPFAGGVFPVGRLREPWSALERADCIVLTRGQKGEEYPALVREIRKYNAEAPVFRSWLREVEWRDAFGMPGDVGAKPAAFCGLGNPDSFWRSLDRIGIPKDKRRAYPDHHQYQITELQEMAGGHDTLLTTEKDLMNLPAGWEDALGNKVRLLWLSIGIEMEDEAGFRAWVMGRVGLL